MQNGLVKMRTTLQSRPTISIAHIQYFTFRSPNAQIVSSIGLTSIHSRRSYRQRTISRAKVTLSRLWRRQLLREYTEFMFITCKTVSQNPECPSLVIFIKNRTGTTKWISSTKLGRSHLVSPLPKTCYKRRRQPKTQW